MNRLLRVGIIVSAMVKTSCIGQVPHKEGQLAALPFSMPRFIYFSRDEGWYIASILSSNIGGH